MSATDSAYRAETRPTAVGYNRTKYGYDGIGRLEGVSGGYPGDGTLPGVNNAYDFDSIGNLVLKDGKTLTYGGFEGPHQVISFGAQSISYAGVRRHTKISPGETESYRYTPLHQLEKITRVTGTESEIVEFKYDYSGTRVSRITNDTDEVRYFSRFAESRTDGTFTRNYWLGDILIASAQEDDPQYSRFELLVYIPWEWVAGLGLVLAVLLIGVEMAPRTLVGLRTPAPRAVGCIGLVLWLSVPTIFFVPKGANAGGGGPPAISYRHFHIDRLGSTQAVTDGAGALVEQVRYKAYGEVRLRADGAGVPIAAHEVSRDFTGYESEPISGLQYAGARFYDPELGQFLSIDPAGHFASPYSYTGWDPVNRRIPRARLQI